MSALYRQLDRTVNGSNILKSGRTFTAWSETIIRPGPTLSGQSPERLSIFAMKFIRRDAVRDDLPRIVEIYNHAVLTRESTCDLKPVSIADRLAWFEKHSGSDRPIWVAEDSDAEEFGVVGYAGFYHFMNDRPGYFITSDLAIYLHPDYQGKRLGTFLLREAIAHAPSLGIEVLAVTIFASNSVSIKLFEGHGFERWGLMPRVARLGDIERDLVMMGRRLEG